MSIFRTLICKVILDYKCILKRHLSAAQAKFKILAMGLRRKDLNQANEIELYQKGEQILADVDQRLAQQDELPSWYSGLDEFRQHLQSLLTDYRLLDAEVVHAAQKASSLTVQALQILTLSAENLAGKQAELSLLGQQIADLGTADQHTYYLNLLKKAQEHHPTVLPTLLNEFEQHLKTSQQPTSA